MLSDQEFRPGARPTRFDAGLNCYIFKEGRQYHVRSKAAAGGRSDRWHNSGGAKATGIITSVASVDWCRRLGIMDS